MMTKITGEDLTRWRKSMGWTRERAATELNTNCWTYRYWERKKGFLPGIVAVAIRAVDSDR